MSDATPMTDTELEYMAKHGDSVKPPRSLPKADSISEILSRTDSAIRDEVIKSSSLSGMLSAFLDLQSRHRKEQADQLELIIQKINSICTTIKG